MKLSSAKRGFTLIELLVVIAIIGILSSVVLASLGTARTKARDATRISDMKNMQLALELYYDSLQSYPANTIGANAHFFGAGITAALTPTYIPNLPSDPLAANTQYVYKASDLTDVEVTADGSAVSYILGATLENAANPVLGGDQVTNVTGGTTIVAEGLSTGGSCIAAGTGGTDICYSLRP